MGTITEREDEFMGNLALLDDALLQYEYVLAFADEVEDLPEGERTEQTRIRGCSSRAWMSLEASGGVIRMRAASDALVIRGIMGIISALTKDAPCAEVATWRPRFLDAPGVAAQLSANRRSGVSAMLKRVIAFAESHA